MSKKQGRKFKIQKEVCAVGKSVVLQCDAEFPPDIVHGLFEGVIPVEIALCLTVLISKK